MDTAAIIAAIAAILKTAVDLGPTVIKGIEDARPFAEAIASLIKGTDVTQDQLDELEAKVTALSDQLQAPLPPDDGTTTT